VFSYPKVPKACQRKLAKDGGVFETPHREGQDGPLRGHESFAFKPKTGAGNRHAVWVQITAVPIASQGDVIIPKCLWHVPKGQKTAGSKDPATRFLKFTNNSGLFFIQKIPKYTATALMGLWGSLAILLASGGDPEGDMPAGRQKQLETCVQITAAPFFLDLF